MAASSLANNSKSKTVVVWYDPTAYSENNREARKSFEATFGDQALIHNNEEIAKQMFAREKANTTIILITSGSIGKDFVRKIHSSQNLKSIYIFCGNPDYHREWTKDYSKIKDVQRDFQTIYATIQETLRSS